MASKEEFEEKLGQVFSHAEIIEEAIKAKTSHDSSLTKMAQEWLKNEIFPHIKGIQKLINEIETDLDEFDFIDLNIDEDDE